MAKVTFETRLVRPDGTGTWTLVDLPAAASERLGAPARLPVRGSVAEQPVRSTLMVRSDGSRYLVVPRPIRDAAGVTAGDSVLVELETDPEPRDVEVPADLYAALNDTAGAPEAFERLAPSHRRAYVAWVEDAKRSETRARRMAKAVDMIAAGEKLNG